MCGEDEGLVVFARREGGESGDARGEGIGVSTQERELWGGTCVCVCGHQFMSTRSRCAPSSPSFPHLIRDSSYVVSEVGLLLTNLL